MFRRVILLILVLCPIRIYAATDPAQAYYMAGRNLMVRKDFKGAVVQFTQSLASNPRYAWSNRERATSYYYLGNRSAAISDYKRYLQMNPSDKKTAEFLQRLEPSTRQTPAAAQSRPRMAIKLKAGYNTYSFSDWNAIWGTAANSSSGSSTSSVGGGTITSGLNFGGTFLYRISPQWLAGFDLDYLMASSSMKVASGSGASTSNVTLDFNLPVLWIGPSINFVIPEVFSKTDLYLGGGLGWLTLMGGSHISTGANSGGGSSSASTSSSFSGSGLGFKVSTGMDYFFSRSWSVNAELGWRLATIGEVKESPVYISSAFGGNGTLKKIDGSTLPLDYSGLIFSIGVSKWF